MVTPPGEGEVIAAKRLAERVFGRLDINDGISKIATSIPLAAIGH